MVDERAHRVTHVVVEGRLLPASRLRDAGPDGLVADLTPDQLKRLPEENHEHVVAPGSTWQPPGGYALENFLAIAEALIGQSPYVPPVHLEEDLDEVHEITEGSPVWRGRRRLGKVERVLTDDEGRVTDLVIDREGILAGRGLLHASRITAVVGNNVHTDLAEDEELPDFQE